MGNRKKSLWAAVRATAGDVLREILQEETARGGVIERAAGLLPVGTIIGLDDMVDAYTASSVACVKRCVEIKAGSVASLGCVGSAFHPCVVLYPCGVPRAYSSPSQSSTSFRAMLSFSGSGGRLSLPNQLPRSSSDRCRWISPPA